MITNLTNHAMPLIRYNQGDMIELSVCSETCEQIKLSRVIKVIEGRTSEFIYDKKGHMISPMFLLEIIAQINNEMKDIIVEYQYSFMQSKKLLICNIQLAHGREKWFDSVNELILRYFAQKRAAGVTIDILVEHVYFVKDKKIKKRTLEFLE